MEPGRLNLDINQTSLADDDPLFASLGDLRATGACLHVDDFGAGLASFGQLQVAELDSVKLDRSFLGVESRALRGVVAMARDLGKQVIAEGVENADQLRLVRDVGCHSAQGFLFSQPVEASKASALLTSMPVA